MNDDRAEIIRAMMHLPPHTPWTHQGRTTTVAEALRSLLKGDGAATVNKPQEIDPTRGSLAPSADALAGLSDADRTALERGEGIQHLTRPADVTIRTKQDDGNHGSSSFHFRTNPQTGAVERSHGPNHLAGDNDKTAQPTVTRESGAPSKTTYRAAPEQRNPWALIDRG